MTRPPCTCLHRALSHTYIGGANTGPCLALGCGCGGYTPDAARSAGGGQ